MRTKTILTLTAVSVLLVTGIVAAGLAPIDGDDSTLAIGTAAAEPESTNSLDTQTQQQPLVRGEPRLRVNTPEKFVTPGNTNEVELTVSNDGSLSLGTAERREVVTTARNVRVEAEADDPLTVTTGQAAIGSVTENEPRSVPIAIDVPEDVEEGTYDVDVELKYAHTRQESGGVTNDRSRTITRTVEVEVRDEARFAITSASTDVQIGDTGTIETDIENIGSETANNVNVVLDSASAGLVIGESPEAGDSARVGELEPGETATVAYDASLSGDAPLRQYSLNGDVQFRNADGIQRVDEGVRTGVTPVEKQRFSVDDIESDLYVGEDGDVRGTITNDGPNEARNVVVQYTDESPNVIPIESSVAVGTLGSGESSDFRMPIEIGGEAEPVDRTADIAVQYRNADLERRAYEDLELLFDVEPKRDQFQLAVQDREIASGETIVFDVEVTNNLDQTVEDVEARLFASDPLNSEDDEAYAESLESGESTTMTFELEAESGATEKTYPVSFDFRYDDERGSSQLSDTTRVPITVVPAEGGFPWLLVTGALVLVAVAGGGYYLYARET